MKTKREWQDLWLKTLETTDLKQGRGFLHQVKASDHFYCCLGIACELYKQEGQLKTKRKDNRISYNGDTAGLPPMVVKAFGFNTSMSDSSGNRPALFQLNDKGKTFKEIAKYVRRNRKAYFQ